MAKNLNITVKADTSQAITMIKWFTSSLKGADVVLKEFLAELWMATSAMKNLGTASTTAETPIKKTSKAIKETWNESLEAEKKMWKMKLAMISVWDSMSKAFWKAPRFFSTLANDVIRTTKLLGVMATVAWWVQLNRSKNEYLAYSWNMVWLQNVTWANTSESKAILNNMIANISSRIWTKGSETISNITDTASWWITVDLSWPDAQKNADAFEEIQTRVWLFGRAFKTSALDVNKAVVSLWHSLWLTEKQLNDPKEINILMWKLGLALKWWIWSLSEYTTAIPKFISIYTAWATSPEEKERLTNEALAVFTNKTLSATPAMAAFTSRAFWEDFWNTLRQSKAGSTKITNLLKSKKDSEWNAIPFSFLWDEEKTKKVQWFLNKYENADSIRKQIFYNKDWKQATPLESAFNLKTILTQWEKETGIKKSELLWLFTTNVNTRKAILDILNDKDNNIWKLTEAFQDNEKAQKYLNDSIKNAQESSAFSFDKMVADFNNLTNNIWNKLSPAMNSLSSIISDAFSWGTIDMVKFNKVFDDTYNKLKDTNPILAKLVSYMKNFWNYVASWEAEKSFKNMLTSIENLMTSVEKFWSAISSVWNSWPMKWLRDLIFWWDITVAIVWYSALKLAIAAGFDLAVVALKTSLILPFTLAWTAAWEAAQVWLLKWLGWMLIWWAIWVLIWKWIHDYFIGWPHEKEMAELNANIITTSNDSLLTSNVKDLTKDKKNELIDNYSKVYDKKYSFTNLSRDQTRLIKEVEGRWSAKDIQELKEWVNINWMERIFWNIDNVKKFLKLESDLRLTNSIFESPIPWTNILKWNLPEEQAAAKILLNTIETKIKLDTDATNNQTTSLGQKLDNIYNIINAKWWIIWGIPSWNTNSKWTSFKLPWFNLQKFKLPWFN